MGNTLTIGEIKRLLENQRDESRKKLADKHIEIYQVPFSDRGKMLHKLDQHKKQLKHIFLNQKDSNSIIAFADCNHRFNLIPI